MPISFTPLSGALSGSPPCYLLEIDDAKILLDCGALEGGQIEPTQDVEAYVQAEKTLLERLEQLAPHLTLILLSHPLPRFIGLLPLLINQFKLAPTCMIYCSPPTLMLGRLALLEWITDRSADEDAGVAPPSIVDRDEVATETAAALAPWKQAPSAVLKALSRVTTIRFNSPLLLSGRNAPLTLLASRAGHTLGGTIWTLRTPTNDEILYAPVWNHVKEKAIDGAELRAVAAWRTRRRGIVIAGAEQSRTITPKSVARNGALLEIIKTTLRSGRSVLIPCDTAARLIELLILLDQDWTFSHLHEFPICLISRQGRDLPLAFKNLVEFFGTNMQGSQAQTTLRLPQVRFFGSVAEYPGDLPPDRPRLILANPANFAYGPSRQLFVDFAQTAGNVIVLLQPGEPGTLAHNLFTKWQAGQAADQQWGNAAGRVGVPVALDEALILSLNRRILLLGADLQDFQDRIAAQANRQARQKALLERSRLLREAAGADSDSESSDEEEEDEDNIGGITKTVIQRDAMQDVTNALEAGPHDVPIDEAAPSRAINWDEFIDAEDPRQGAFDIYVRGQQTRRAEFSKPAPGASKDDPLVAPARLRIFPFVDRRKKVDAYGEVVDVQGWLTRGRAKEVEGQPEFGGGARDVILGKRKRDEDEVKEKAEDPHRFVTEEVSVQLACTIFAVDFEAKADGRALKTLLPHLNPRKLVLIGGDTEATNDLAESCRAVATMSQDIFEPAVDECIEVGQDVKMFSLKLDDELLSKLAMRKIEDYEIVRVHGAVSFADESSIPTITQPAITGRAITPTDDSETAKYFVELFFDDSEPLMEPSATLGDLPPTIWIGDVKVAALRRQLNAVGIPAVFAGEGVLVCGPMSAKTAAATKAAPSKAVSLDPRRRAKVEKAETPEPEDVEDSADGRVAVRKDADGSLMIEGPPGETFMAVRSAIYALHAAA